MFSMAGERRWNPAWTVNEAPVVRWEDLHGPCRLHNTTVLGKRAPVEVILANPTSEQWCRVGVLVTVHLVAKYTYRMMSDWPCVSALVGSCLRLGCSTSRTRTSQSLSVEHSSPRSSTRCISATRAAPTTVAMAETPQRNRRLIRHAGGSGREAVPRLRQICREEPVSPQIIRGERLGLPCFLRPCFWNRPSPSFHRPGSIAVTEPRKNCLCSSSYIPGNIIFLLHISCIEVWHGLQRVRQGRGEKVCLGFGSSRWTREPSRLASSKSTATATQARSTSASWSAWFA